MKKRVYEFTTGDYAGIVFESLDAIFEWIKADIEGAYINDEFPYEIKVVEMTEEEIANLPEADF
jgi:hypothetical protein